MRTKTYGAQQGMTLIINNEQPYVMNIKNNTKNFSTCKSRTNTNYKEVSNPNFSVAQSISSLLRSNGK